MRKKDPRVDDYIAKSAEFARPILKRLRTAVHAGCPDVEETIKWGAPHFMHEGILASMAAFTRHCAFGFWKGELIEAKLAKAKKGSGDAWGQLGRMASADDLPSERMLVALVREAVKLNEAGVKLPSRSRSKPRPEVDVPADLSAALHRNRKARATFDGFPPSHRREYVEWITEAKTDATRARRLATTIEWLADGKPRDWKYARR
jgi:uncharacterized protein YdeI (YjbR/CyaY-like superfamily)